VYWNLIARFYLPAALRRAVANAVMGRFRVHVDEAANTGQPSEMATS
jgi:hypothetical protein